MKRLFNRLMATAFIVASTQASAAIDSKLLKGLEARAIGPAATSGRVTDIEAVVSNPNIIYAGTATGGLWKSVNAGLNWTPIFDDQDFASIGAIAINQQNPNIVWVGTGEGNTRNSTSYGGGMFKSIDGGQTWQKIGLAGTERINRIALHPTNPDIAYVAALGTLWSENKERGLYKTEDGGKTWTQVLYVDEKTGATDVKMDPSNPNKLYAAMWQFRRWPYRFESGGKGSGLYVSNDGGKTWSQKTQEDGLPEGDLGRMVIAVSQSNPDRIYTLVEAKKSALIRSDDGGNTWQQVNTEIGIADRPFYYSELEVDPSNDNIVYNIATLVRRSIDGGKNFSTISSVSCCAAGNTIHIDNHTLWINPNDSDHLILGNDGGIAITQDKAQTWRFVQNLPVSQFYHVRVDNAVPYNIYGGLQDNGSWRGPSEVWESAGIRTLHWQEIGFGDGFDAMPFPDDTQRGYAMSQGGNLTSFNLTTGEQKLVRPNPPLDEAGKPVDLRFNWSAGLAQDPFDPATIYYGSQFVHKSTDRAASWTVISDDLTTNNPDWQRFKDSGGITSDVTAAENYTTIVSIAPSTVKQGVIWVGTDDGRLHVTQDGGTTWTSLESKIKGVPANSWIPHIEPSPHDAGTAFVVFDNHRRGDMSTYVYKLENFGKKSRSIASKNLRGYALSFQQDHVDPNLLFLGTELGLYVSTSGGKQWFKFDQGVPTVSVMDMAIHEGENDLVLGTHGRSIFVIDDYSGLRGLNEDAFSQELALLAVSDGQQYIQGRAAGSRFWGNSEFVGDNEAYGVMLTVIASGEQLVHPDSATQKALAIAKRNQSKDDEKESKATNKAKVEVSDAQGNIVRTFETELQKGVNRIMWPMNADGAKPAPGEERKDGLLPPGPQVPPGTYTLKVTLNDSEFVTTANVLIDPRVSVSQAQLEEKFAYAKEVNAMRSTLSDLLATLADSKANIELVQAAIKQGKTDDNDYADLSKQATELLEQITAQQKQLITLPDAVGIVDTSYKLSSKIGTASGYINSTYGSLSDAGKQFLAIAQNAVKQEVSSVNSFVDNDLAKFMDAFSASDLSVFKAVKTVQ